jgi:predicted RNase H-like HicB family nuclease
MAKNRAKKESKFESLEYQVNLSFDPRDNIYVARVPELENCHTHGATPGEAIQNAKEAIELWLETARDKKISIPEPMGRKKFSGKFVVRAPENLHASLAREALRRGKSMNELAIELLSRVLKKGA